jgi:hypothetical protein
MGKLAETVQGWWDHAKAAKAKTRACFSIDPQHVDDGKQPVQPPFDPTHHYFQVTVHEMFLANAREWFVNYEPMVVAAAAYIYDRGEETVPFVAGPAMLKDFGQGTPGGMIFRNTPVSGFNPYQGGKFTLTLVLYKVQRQNNAERLLQVVEGVSKALDPSNTMSSYLRITGAIVDGVESLLGLKETVPVLGYRETFNPDVGQNILPNYVALIDEDSAAATMNPERFRVRKSRLYYVDEKGDEHEYRDCDFVLFSISQGDRRSDEKTLSFYPLWDRAADFASHATDESWSEAKAHLNTLSRTLYNHPDLTTDDSERLRLHYLEEIKKIRVHAVERANLASPGPIGKGPLSPTEGEKQIRQVREELDSLDEM